MNNKLDNSILKVRNVSKQYRLGVIGTGTISHDLNRWWAKIRGKEDPFLTIGTKNDRTSEAKSDYVWSLKDINFSINKGEVVGIIGKNGAGKSTLLKILSKVTSPTTGTVKSRGRIASLLEVGTGFHPEMTGKENIFLNGAILGMTKNEIQSKFKEIVEFSGCKKYIDTPVKRYSSGMKVRLAFAVAAFLEPDILVVDEVLAVGDAEFQKKAIGKMQDISNTEGRTVLFVSHDMSAIQSLCSRLIVLLEGEISFDGDVSSGIDFYMSNGVKRDYNFESIKNRKGNGNILFSAVNLSYYSLNENILFEKVQDVPSGVRLYIDVILNNRDNIMHDNVFISIKINDSVGVPITNLSNEFTDNVIELQPGINTCRFEIENFNLREGDYLLSFWGKDGFGCFDSIDEVMEIKVVKSDFFGTGKYPSKKKHGVVLIKSIQYTI